MGTTNLVGAYGGDINIGTVKNYSDYCNANGLLINAENILHEISSKNISTLRKQRF